MTRTPEEQAAALLAGLSLPEKIAFLHQHQPAVERLGLAGFHTGCEALHGVAWIGRATVFPQAVGLGATWDRELLRRVGEAVSTEVRAFKQDAANAVRLSGRSEKPPMVSLNVWAPVVNLLRDPRWGRNEEGYSEDPFATAQLATAYCRGLRGEHPAVWRTTPVLKHFLAYNIETDRDVVDVHVPERVLHEYELPAFRGPIQAGVVAGVMPGYNLTNGIPNHVHPLIREALRAWDPELAVCSDAQAPSNLVEREKFFPTHAESHAAALKAGVDSYTDNDTDSQPTIERFTEALRLGLITEADVDESVRRLLLLRARGGEFAPESDPYAAIRADAIDCESHRELAREAASASVVLLKNDGGALPLPADGSAPRRIAVIGHLGTRVLTDWYSGTLPYAVTIADGLAARFAAADTEILAVDGADVVRLRAADGHRDGDGYGAGDGAGDDVGGDRDFGTFRHQDWGTSAQCPVPVHTLQSVDDGRYLTLSGEDDSVVEAAAETPDGWHVKELWEFESAGAGEGVFLLRSNAPHSRRYARIDPDDPNRLLADVVEAGRATPFRLEPVSSGTDEAVRAAGEAERVVLVLGNDPHINGRETVDRAGIALPPQQDLLLRAVQAANPAAVLVLVSSYPYAIDWAARHVPAILWTSHAGQELGTAVASVLTGGHNPSGRLPQTWYSERARLPQPQDYDVIGAGWTYRHSRQEHVFPFGHGLSYAAFEYGTPAATPRVDGPEALTVAVGVAVANRGPVGGHEVVQLYARRIGAVPDGPQAEPLRVLVGFERIFLAAGERRDLVFEVPGELLERWDESSGRAVVPAGEYEFEAGPSSADLPAGIRVKVS